MQYGKKKLFIDINRAGKVTEKLSAGQRLAGYEHTHKCGTRRISYRRDQRSLDESRSGSGFT
jgi:hypothetical protein